ncbi:MAG TPA: ECF transporter S component [Ktedonobacterales bacterium]
MSQLSADRKAGVFTFTTSRLVTAAVLVALTIVIAPIPFVGFFPVPNATGAATTEHIPTILGSVLAGPLVGMITGLLFGLISFVASPLPFLKDPLVSVLPRMLIGLTPWLVYTAVMYAPFGGARAVQRDVAAGVAGLVGSLTNSVLVLGFAVLRGYFPAAIFLLSLPQIVAEAIAATVVTIIVARAVYITRNQIRRAPERKQRDQLPY